MLNSLILGLDPAKRNFTACLMDTQGVVLVPSEDFACDRAGFELAMARLRPHRAVAGRLVVGIEASASLDDNLLAFFAGPDARADGEVSLLRVDAGQVARFSGPRPIRGKTDKSDARRIAEFTRAYAGQLQAFEADKEAQAMARLVNEREQLVRDNTALKNRLQDRLVISFPEFERVFVEPCSELALAVLRVVPTAAVCARKRAVTLAKIRARKHGHCVGEERAGKLIALAGRSIASATASSDADTILYLVARLELNLGRIHQIEAQMKLYVGEPEIPASAGVAESPAPQPCVSEIKPASLVEQIRLADSLPGTGLVGGVTLVLRSRDLTRFTSGKALAAQLGACPDREQTGSSKDRGHLTHRGDRRTRSTLYVLVQTACQFDPAMAFHKWRLVQKGMTPKQAVCACMNRYVNILWSMVNQREAYDVKKTISNAKKHHPELWKTFVRDVLPTLKKMTAKNKTHAQTA